MKKLNATVWRGVRFRTALLLTLIWILLVLYPNPVMLAKSVYRTMDPPIQPGGDWLMVSERPRTAPEAEAFVLERFPYQYDWLTYGVPWYFPTLEESLEKGTGDCKTRFIVLASLLEDLDIPYQPHFSFSHFWIHYENKKENVWERESNAFMVRQEDGALRLQLPREDRSQILDNFRRGFWEAMPRHRKWLLITGTTFFLLTGFSGLIKPFDDRRRKNPGRLYA